MAVKKPSAASRVNLDKALAYVGEYYLEEVRSQLIQDGTQSTGELAASLDTNIVGDEIDIVNTKYGKAVDEGSRPASQGSAKVSKAFIADILEWASLKGITPDKGGSMKGMAFAIAKTIKKRGVIKRFGNQGSKVFDRVYKRLEEQIGEDISEGYLKDIKNKLTNI